MKYDYCIVERSEKDQNCKLQFPQADYLPRHSPDHFPFAKLAKRVHMH